MQRRHDKWVPLATICKLEVIELFVTPAQLREAADFLEAEMVNTLPGDAVPTVQIYQEKRTSGIEIHLCYQCE